MSVKLNSNDDKELIEVFLMGISKIDKNIIIEEAKSKLKKQKKKVIVRRYDVFEYMQKAAEDINIRLSEKNVLHLRDDQLELLRINACTKIQECIQKDAHREYRDAKRRLLAIITTHSSFHTKSGIKRSLHGHKNLLADHWFYVVHDIQNLWEALKNDQLGRWDNITLPEVIEWRDRDFIDSCDFASNRGIPFCLLALREPIDTFLNIVMKPKMRRAYCSYPMSHTGSGTERKVKKFIEKLRQYLIVFDPINVEEYGPEKKRLDNLRARGKKVSHKLFRLLDRVGEETVKRDFQLIKQSKMVIVYFPPASESETVAAIDKCIQNLKESNIGNKKKNLQKLFNIARESAAQIMPLSPGVISEMAEAHTTQKEVYGLWLNKKILPSPFFKHWCTKYFTSEKDFLKFLKSEIKNFNI